MFASADPWEFGWTAVAAIATAVGSIAVFATLVFAARQLSRTAKTAESEHLADVLRKWDDERLEEARHAVNQYDGRDQLLQALVDGDAQSTKDYFVLLRVPNFFEDVGNLVFDQKVVRIESVRHGLRGSVRYYWQLFEPFAQRLQEEQRKRGEEATVFEAFRKLAEQV